MRNDSEPVFAQEAVELMAVGHAELGESVGAVRFHGALLQRGEFQGDLPVRLAFGDEPRHLFLARGQLVPQGLGGTPGLPAGGQFASVPEGLGVADIGDGAERNRLIGRHDLTLAQIKDAKPGDRLTVLLQRGPMSLYVAFTIERG